jgi:D-3-phosphoglycerate dehydrogenase / 2-oxoglutarate reductase
VGLSSLIIGGASMTFKVVMVIDYARAARDLPDRVKATGVDLTVYNSIENEDKLISICQDADYIISQQGLFPFTPKVLKSLPKLRFFQTLSIGCDALDFKTATEQGIGLINLRGFCVEELAEQAMALMLASARWVGVINTRMKMGKIVPPASPDANAHMSILKGKTLGLVGFGGSAKEMVPKARGFEMNILAYDPYVPDKVFERLNVKKVDLNTLLRESDFVSIHTGLSDETRHMISTEQFKMMKKNAYIINIARGPIIDEKALCAAVSEGLIAGAGLDTTEKEPVPADSPLLKFETILLTGHNAGNSPEARLNTAIFPVRELVRVMNGEWPLGLVNPEVKKNYIAKWGEMKEPKESQ